jgi:lipopolysaccharide export system permease protein
MTFFIVMFILLMQFLWKYIDDLVGKGLSFDVIAELLLYASAGLIPMALPLSTLLASLMTMGNLGENNELLAMKSAGISLPRIMQPLIYITIVISISAFFFSNNVLPYTNLKISSLLWDVKQQRPELQIKVGVFNNDIDDYVIKVGSKDPRTSLMRNILIYDHGSKEGNLMVTIADSGYMHITNDSKYMVVTLYSGYSYEEMVENRSARRSNKQKFPARRNKFDEQLVLLELKGFDLQRSNEDLFRSSYHALNLQQLKQVSDSIGKEIDTRRERFKKVLKNGTIISNPYGTTRDSLAVVTHFLDNDSLFNSLNMSNKHSVISRALSNARSAKNHVSTTNTELHSRGKFMVRHRIEWHRKFSLSFACFVFFFIGAPLGAIIRKGGLGMPVVVSVLFFVVYYIISLTGEKFARELYWTPNLGMWVSSFILLPLGAFLSYKATTDSVIMNADFYINAAKKVLRIQRRARVMMRNVK